MHRGSKLIALILCNILLFTSFVQPIAIYALALKQDDAFEEYDDAQELASDNSDSDSMVTEPATADPNETGNSSDGDAVQRGSEYSQPVTANQAEIDDAASAQDDLDKTMDIANSWRYVDGQRIESTSEDNGVSPYSMGTLPDGATAQGIDVSSWQGDIDWDSVKDAGIDFAIIRLGYWTNGVDKKLERNVAECERVGIPWGAYLYSYCSNPSQAAMEADHAIELLGRLKSHGYTPDLPIYFDMEDDDLLKGNRDFAGMATQFCEKIEAAGYSAGVYANKNWWTNYLTSSVFNNWTQWVAQYNSVCTYQGPYRVWQYTSSGSVPGISGTVDINYSYGNYTPNMHFDAADELAAEHAGDLSDGTYTLTSSKRGDGALDAKDGSVGLGTPVQLWESNGTDAQGWVVTHDGDYVVIANAKSGLVLDAADGSSARGTSLRLWEPNGSRAQRWIAVKQGDGSYVLHSAMNPDRVVDLVDGSTSNGARLQLWEPNGTAAQSWRLGGFKAAGMRADELAAEHAGDLSDGTYTLTSSKRGDGALDAKDGSVGLGTPVQLWESNGTDAQGWVVTHDGDYVVIANAKSGLVLDAADGSSARGTSLRLWEPNGSRAQRWIAVKQGDGSYVLHSAMNPDRVVDLVDGSTSNGARLQLWEPNGTAAQSWRLGGFKAAGMRADDPR